MDQSTLTRLDAATASSSFPFRAAIVVGGGNMGRAFARGLLASSSVAASRLVVVDTNTMKRLQLQVELKVQTQESLSSPAFSISKWLQGEAQVSDSKRAPSLVCIAVKPGAVAEVAGCLSSSLPSDTVLISCAAGIRLSLLERTLSGHEKVVRCMPNLPIQVCAGVTGYSCSAGITVSDRLLIATLFNSLGISLEVQEDQLDIITALSGSGPGFFAFLLEQFIRSGCEAGMSEEVVTALVTQTAVGTLKLLKETSGSPKMLCQQVTSPNGTTAAGLDVFNRLRVGEAIREAVRAAESRSKAIAQV